MLALAVADALALTLALGDGLVMLNDGLVPTDAMAFAPLAENVPSEAPPDLTTSAIPTPAARAGTIAAA